MPQAKDSEVPFYSSNDEMRCYECRVATATRLWSQFHGTEIEDLYLCEKCSAEKAGNHFAWLVRDL